MQFRVYKGIFFDKASYLFFYIKIETSRQLSAFLIPIPEEFKIEVHVIEKLDGAMEPMNPDYAQGHYVSITVLFSKRFLHVIPNFLCLLQNYSS